MFDKEHYQELIEQLKPVVNEPEFDEIFAQLTTDETGPTKLQLKMELRRLVAPCSRSIDMRSDVIYECTPISHNGRIHYLDARAQRIFEHDIAMYQGVFTQDTYEKIQALAKDPDADTGLTIDSVSSESNTAIYAQKFELAGYMPRNEERMNYVIDIAVHTESGDEIEAATTDISVQGLRIKMTAKDAADIHSDQILDVRFTGLAKKFTIDQSKRIPYRVLKVELDDNQNAWLQLRRRADFKSDNFDDFLLGFINGHKKRYKINLDNTMSALIAKGHEQFYLPRMNALPIFFKRIDQKMFTDMLLQTDNNQDIVDHWRDESNQPVIGGLFSGRRLSNLLKQPGAHKHSVIYSFSISSKGRIYFYSATAAELEQSHLKDVFIQFGRQKDSWRVYQFNMTKANKGKIWIPLSVPEAATSVPFRPPSPRVMKRLDGIAYIGQLIDVTDIATPEIQGHELKRQDGQRLKQFAHAQHLPYKTQVVPLAFVNLRKESRFNYRTPAKFSWSGRNYYGVTADFSISGLQIELEGMPDIPLETELTIDLTELNRHRRHVNLLGLKYRVMGKSEDGSVLNLMIAGPKSEHIGAQFFAKLIENNREELTITREKNQLHGIELCLRNLCCASLMSLPMFIHKDKQNALRVNQVGYSPDSGVLFQILDQATQRTDQVNIEALFDHHDWADIMVPSLNQLERNHPPKMMYLALDVHFQDGILSYQHQWLSATESGLIATEQLAPNAEIEEDVGQPAASEAAVIRRVFRLNLTRTGRPDIEFIQKELSYLSSYASHRASDIEDMLWRVFGVIDCQDVSKPVLLAQGMPADTINAQQRQLEQWLAEAAL